MKSNQELGFVRVGDVCTSLKGGEYELGWSGNSLYRAYGYEWYHNRDSSLEGPHHVVCGRGNTPEEAIKKMIDAAIRAGAAGSEAAQGGRDCWITHHGLSELEALRLMDELLEMIAEHNIDD